MKKKRQLRDKSCNILFCSAKSFLKTLSQLFNFCLQYFYCYDRRYQLRLFLHRGVSSKLPKQLKSKEIIQQQINV